MIQKPKKLALTREQHRKLLRFFNGCTVLAAGEPAAVGARMAQLRAMGLEDLPAYEGFSSSVRQYALTSVAIDDQRRAGKPQAPTVFVTTDAGLLERADALHRRFGLRPISLDALRATQRATSNPQPATSTGGAS